MMHSAKTLRVALLWGAAVVLSAGTGSALAGNSNVKVAFAGTVNAGVIDTFGYFGPKGGDLSGKPFAAKFAYNTADFMFLQKHLYQTKNAQLARTIKASLEINGISQKEIPTVQVVVQAEGGGIFIYPKGRGNLYMIYSLFGSLAHPGKPASAVEFDVNQAANQNETIAGTVSPSKLLASDR